MGDVELMSASSPGKEASPSISRTDELCQLGTHERLKACDEARAFHSKTAFHSLWAITQTRHACCT